MESSVMWLIFGTALMGLLWLLYWYRRGQRLSPYQLETLLRIEEPVPLVGKPDVVWINGRGDLVVGDYKSRAHDTVYPSEVIQLSVYKLLLEKTQKRRVKNYGYIHFSGGRKEKVKLLKEKQVLALYRRYQALLAGKVEPRQRETEQYCRYCSHRQECR